jgi:hypothetical protein
MIDGLGPLLAPILGLAGVVLVAAAGIWNRRHGNRETKGASQAETWAELRQRTADLRVVEEERDGERRWRRFFEDLVHVLGRALLSVAERTALLPHERRALEQFNDHIESKEDA